MRFDPNPSILLAALGLLASERVRRFVGWVVGVPLVLLIVSALVVACVGKYAEADARPAGGMARTTEVERP